MSDPSSSLPRAAQVREYLQHKATCAVQGDWVEREDYSDADYCTCGLDKLLSTLQSREQAQEPDFKQQAEAMATRLRQLIANPVYADTRAVLEIRLDTIETLLNPPPVDR